jgi:hypothetical protein
LKTKKKSDDNIKNSLKAHDETVWPGFIWRGTGTLVIIIQARKGKTQKRYSSCLMVEASDHGHVLHTRHIRIQHQWRLAILNQFSVLI